MERVFLKSGFYSWRGSLLTFAKNIPTQGASKLGRRHCSLLPGMKPVDPKGRDSADHGTTFPVVPSLVRAGALVAEIRTLRRTIAVERGVWKIRPFNQPLNRNQHHYIDAFVLRDWLPCFSVLPAQFGYVFGYIFPGQGALGFPLDPVQYVFQGDPLG